MTLYTKRPPALRPHYLEICYLLSIDEAEAEDREEIEIDEIIMIANIAKDAKEE